MRAQLLCGTAIALALTFGTGLAGAEDQTQKQPPQAGQNAAEPEQQNARGQTGSGQPAAPQAQVKGDLSIAKTPEDKKKAEKALEDRAAAAAQGNGSGASDGTSQPAQIDHHGTTPDELQRAEQAVLPEPTNQAPTQPAFVDGKPAVPGGPADPQTAPAKFSEKNDAIDKLNQNALTQTQLPDDKRHALYLRLSGGPQTTGSASNDTAQVGVELPATVQLQPLPEDVTQQMPNLAIYRYARAGDKVLLVEPTNRIVVAVLSN